MSYKPQHAIAWTEIPVSDFDKGVEFYRKALGLQIDVDTSGPNPMGMIATDGPGVAGHIYSGKPGKGAGPTLHFNVSGTVEKALKDWVAAGGRKVSDPIAIPPGRFAYVEDPDGNSIGLFEAAKA